MREPRDLSARIVLVNDVALRCLRSPLLIASSTVRTAPRSWVRRALLTMVRRAILRVAFLAEVVLAIFSNILRQGSIAAGRALQAQTVQSHDRR
jgi:hypothetical protein